MAGTGRHAPTLAAVREPTSPDHRLGAMRALADVGRSVDHAPTLAGLCQEPRSEVAGLRDRTHAPTVVGG
jgi:hypothetical protein